MIIKMKFMNQGVVVSRGSISHIMIKEYSLVKWLAIIHTQGYTITSIEFL